MKWIKVNSFRRIKRSSANDNVPKNGEVSRESVSERELPVFARYMLKKFNQEVTKDEH